MLSSKSIAKARQAERKQQELAELVRLYDAAETYDEFQANRDIHGLHASSPLPPFSSSNGQDFILVNIPGTADGSKRQELIAYVMLLQRLFDGSENTIANHMPDGLPATSPLSHTLRAYVSVSAKLKRFDSIPDLLADLAADGLDLTSLQPFLEV